MEKLSDQIKQISFDFEKGLEGDSNYEELKSASENYKEMVKEGIIKERGYTLLSIEQTDVIQPLFNCKFPSS